MGELIEYEKYVSRASCELQAASCKLRVASCKLRVDMRVANNFAF